MTQISTQLRIVTYKDVSKQHRYQFLSKNGRIVGDSGQGYKSKAAMNKAIALIKSEARNAEILEGQPRRIERIGGRPAALKKGFKPAAKKPAKKAAKKQPAVRSTAAKKVARKKK